MRPTPWVALIALPVLAATLGTYVLILTAEPGAAVVHAWIPALGIALAWMVGFMRGEISVAGGTLRLRAFPVWTFTIPVGRIRSVEVTSVDAFADYLGVGLRVGYGGSIGIIMRSGPAIAVTTDSGKRYVMVVPDPEAWRQRILVAAS
ncbi:hypothetical protein HNR23_000181 [Nocardiopsis mwathae]|uniref:PH domain-containing protein n=1 Tax=Nocardiopsis mwathae TaxID=1472723 RepID=A0A7X0D3V5_9ACTN|nr:hypothetical protein [Nocardiopsis mwathae]MBB6170121.1 hypothetical protein [Nocardiopsis mwathae]